MLDNNPPDDLPQGELQGKYTSAKLQVKRQVRKIETLQESVRELQQTNRDLRKTMTLVNGSDTRVELSIDALRLQVSNLTSKRKKQAAEFRDLKDEWISCLPQRLAT